MWTKTQVQDHLTACSLLEEIKNKAFAYISSNHFVTEHDVQQFIRKEYAQYNLVSDHDPIVGFNKHAAIPHYFPNKKSSILKKNTFVLIDIWARLNKRKAPYGDITWVGYYGTVPKEVAKVFSIIKKSRDAAVNHIRKQLKKRIPTGKEIDILSRDVIVKAGYGKYILHRTGHSIGTTSPHGTYGHVNDDNKQPLRTNLGYTIEPGIYIKNKFGIRSEIDFYITNDKKLVISSKVQDNLVKIPL